MVPERRFGLILLLGHAMVALAVSDNTCYSPNGTNLTQSQTMTPCNAAAASSHCCNMWDLCLNNGYCFAQGETWHSRLYRGGCTDKAWGKSCPQQCHDVALDSIMDIALAQVEQDGFFCCAAWNQSILNGNYCFTATQGTNQPFTLPQGRAIYDRASGTILNDTAQSALNSPTSTASSSSISASSSSTASAAGNASSQTTSSPSPSPSASPHSDTKLAAVGAGVGVPLGLACVGMFFMLLLERRKRKAAEAALEARSGSNAFPHYAQTTQGYGTGVQAQQSELSSANARFEMGSGQRPTELETPSFGVGTKH